MSAAGPPRGAQHRSAQREGTPANAALRRKLVLLVLALLLVAGLAVAWSWSPLRAWLDVDALVGAVRAAGRSFGPLTDCGTVGPPSSSGKAATATPATSRCRPICASTTST